MPYIRPAAPVVVSNIFYQRYTKSVPKEMNAMASMIVTYLVGAVTSAVEFFAMNRGGNLFQEYSRMNAAPVLLGISVVGLICAYRAGWPLSTASTVQSGFLALALVVVGAVLYHREITFSKVIGTAICLIGLYFINR